LIKQADRTIVRRMSDNQYIKRLQRARNKPILTVRNILLLIILSLAVYAGFYFEYGMDDAGACDGPCENLYSIEAWVLAVAIIFGALIAVAAFVGVVVSLIRRGRKSSSGLNTIFNEDD
jgi:hypothetical protein